MSIKTIKTAEEIKQEELDNLLKQFKLNWNVEKRPFFYNGTNDNGDANLIESDYFGLIRVDTQACLSHCKDSYYAFQNAEVLGAMKSFADKYNIEITNGGSFNGGKKIFFQMKLDDELKIGKDTVEEYIFAANSFDHSSKLAFGYTNIVVSCQNSFNRMMKSDVAYRFKHTVGSKDKILEIPDIFAEHLQLRKETNEIFLRWEGTAASKAMAEELIAYVAGYDRMPTTKEKEELKTRSLNILEDLNLAVGKEMNEKGQNLWGLFNGVTYYVNHIKSHPQRENGKLESILIGTGHKMMTEAMQHIEEVYA